MLMRLAVLDGCLRCLRHLCATGDRIVLNQTALIIESIEFIGFVIGDAVAPYLYLVDGILYFIRHIRIIGTVYSHITGITVCGSKLFLGPCFVAIGSTKLRIARFVLGIIHHLTRYRHRLILIPVVGVDVAFFQFALDDSLPVRYQRVFDICLREYELRIELLSYGDTVLHIELIGAVGLLVDTQHASLAEQQVGGAADIGVATFRNIGHR